MSRVLQVGGWGVADSGTKAVLKRAGSHSLCAPITSNEVRCARCCAWLMQLGRQHWVQVCPVLPCISSKLQTAGSEVRTCEVSRQTPVLDGKQLQFDPRSLLGTRTWRGTHTWCVHTDGRWLLKINSIEWSCKRVRKVLYYLPVTAQCLQPLRAAWDWLP